MALQVLSNKTLKTLYTISHQEGIINITREGVEYFLRNPHELIVDQPFGIKFRNEAQKMYEYLKHKNKL